MKSISQKIKVLKVLVTGIILACFLGGCGVYTQQLIAPILSTQKGFAIENLDSTEVFVQSHTWLIPLFGKTSAKVLPGEHSIRVSYVASGWLSGWCYMQVKVDLGRSYRVRGEKFDINESNGQPWFLAKKGPDTIKIRVWVEDIINMEKVSYNEKCTDRKAIKS